MVPLQGLEIPHQRVELLVRDLGRVEYVVALFVVTNQIAQSSGAGANRRHDSIRNAECGVRNGLPDLKHVNSESGNPNSGIPYRSRVRTYSARAESASRSGVSGNTDK